jgi:hypothetical protein
MEKDCCMISPELQKAIDCLKINDVYLRSILAHCEGDFDPKYSNLDALAFQSKHFVKEANIVEFEGKKSLLRVYVDLGARWVEEFSEEDEPRVHAVIEAEYIAEYEMSEPLNDASIDEFALNNASYHVWPYWRELLNNQCTRMHLPRVVLATVQLAQNRKSTSDPQIEEQSSK